MRIHTIQALFKPLQCLNLLHRTFRRSADHIHRLTQFPLSRQHPHLLQHHQRTLWVPLSHLPNQTLALFNGKGTRSCSWENVEVRDEAGVVGCQYYSCLCVRRLSVIGLLLIIVIVGELMAYHCSIEVREVRRAPKHLQAEGAGAREAYGGEKPGHGWRDEREH